MNVIQEIPPCYAVFPEVPSTLRGNPPPAVSMAETYIEGQIL